MKQRSPFLIFPLCFVCVCISVACGDSPSTYEDSSYLIEAVGLEDIHQETIYLKNISYNNTYFKADISGVICVPKTQFSQTYTISNQTVTFNQVYGHVWETELTVEETTEPIKIYASRAGENYTGESKTIECSGRVIDAFEMQKYTYIKYLFFGEINYLKV